MSSFADFESAFQSPAITETVRRSLTLLQPSRLEYLLHPLLDQCALSEDEKRLIQMGHRRSWAAHLRHMAIREEIATALEDLPLAFSGAPRYLQKEESIRPLPARERIELIVADIETLNVAVRRLRKRGFQHISKKRQNGSLSGFIHSRVLRRNVFSVAVHVDGSGILNRATDETPMTEKSGTKILAPSDELFLSLSRFASAWLVGAELTSHVITISQQLRCYGDQMDWESFFDRQRRLGTDRLCASVLDFVCSACHIAPATIGMLQTLEHVHHITYRESDSRIVKTAKLFRMLGVRPASFSILANSLWCSR